METKAAGVMEVEEVARQSAQVRRLVDALNGVLFGQERLVELVVTGILARGHILLEGLPGLGKTELVKGLAKALELGTKRIQFTPDLLPADLIGTLVYDPKDQEFRTRKGPIFANIILADEINRSPAKVQSALQEAMQERTVTIWENTFPLPAPFLVLATQNPIEQEGTYPLPEAQVDRFMLKVLVGYPDAMEEFVIVERVTGPPATVAAVATTEQLAELQRLPEKELLEQRYAKFRRMGRFLESGTPDPALTV